MNKKVYLKPNLVIEPLIGRWYAWPHLISPATAALNIIKRHVEIMNSYIEMPEVHVEAVKNPKMQGGPFMDYNTNRTADISTLMDLTFEKQKKLIDMGFAIKKLNKSLSNCKGFSMESIYNEVPEILKGYVELIYDVNNNPSFRLFEQLVYNEFYSTDFQSISLWLTNNDSRPFVLSTPRLDAENVLNIEVSFDSNLIDEISKMKKTAKEYDEIKQMFKIKTQDEKLFQSFFTENEPKSYQKYTGEKIRMRYFGHACILIETKDLSILIDPLISYYGYTSSIEHFSDFDLPDVIDYILITHNHQDHILLETLLPLRHRIKNIIVPRSGGGALQDPSLKLMFNNIGFKNVIELADMEVVNFIDCSINAIPFTGEHSDLDIKTKTCYNVKIGDFSLLFMADSRVLEPRLYHNVFKQIGKIDVLFLGMECDGAPLSWLYGPLMFEEISKENDQSRRLAGSDCEKGMSLVDIFQPLEVYVYAMGQEPWCEFISSIKYTDESNPIVQSNRLIAECLNRNIKAERLYGEKEILYNKN